MKRVIFMIILALTIPGLGAQDIYERVLADIETNSLTLITLREQLEADKLEINSGRFLSNPEVEFGYLWGKPSSIGNRMNYSIAQSIDFPLVYARKSSIARQQEANAELGYREERAIVLLEARENLVELLYINAMAAEYSYRIANAEAVADMFRKRMDSGASTVQEYNKANINLATVRREASNNELEREAVLSRLRALNGGVDVIFDDSLFVGSELPASFNDWFVEMETNNPGFCGQRCRRSCRIGCKTPESQQYAQVLGQVYERECCWPDTPGSYTWHISSNVGKQEQSEKCGNPGQCFQVGG